MKLQSKQEKSLDARIAIERKKMNIAQGDVRMKIESNRLLKGDARSKIKATRQLPPQHKPQHGQPEYLQQVVIFSAFLFFRSSDLGCEILSIANLTW